MLKVINTQEIVFVKTNRISLPPLYPRTMTEKMDQK